MLGFPVAAVVGQDLLRQRGLANADALFGGGRFLQGIQRAGAVTAPERPQPSGPDHRIHQESRGRQVAHGHPIGDDLFVDRLAEPRRLAEPPHLVGAPGVHQRRTAGGIAGVESFQQHIARQAQSHGDLVVHRQEELLKRWVWPAWRGAGDRLARQGADHPAGFNSAGLAFDVIDVRRLGLSVEEVIKRIGVHLSEHRHGCCVYRCIDFGVAVAVELLDLGDNRRQPGNAPGLVWPLHVHQMKHIPPPGCAVERHLAPVGPHGPDHPAWVAVGDPDAARDAVFPDDSLRHLVSVHDVIFVAHPIGFDDLHRQLIRPVRRLGFHQ